MSLDWSAKAGFRKGGGTPDRFTGETSPARTPYGEGEAGPFNFERVSGRSSVMSDSTARRAEAGDCGKRFPARNSPVRYQCGGDSNVPTN